MLPLVWRRDWFSDDVHMVMAPGCKWPRTVCCTLRTSHTFAECADAVRDVTSPLIIKLQRTSIAGPGMGFYPRQMCNHFVKVYKHVSDFQHVANKQTWSMVRPSRTANYCTEDDAHRFCS